MFEKVLPEMGPGDQMKIAPLFLSFAMLTSQGYEGLEELNTKLVDSSLEVLLERADGVVDEPQTVFQMHKAIQYYKNKVSVDKERLAVLEKTMVQYLKEKKHRREGVESKLWQSRFYKMVTRLVNKEGLHHLEIQNEVQIDQHGLIFADIMINNKLIIELNGPHHFVTKDLLRKPID